MSKAFTEKDAVANLQRYLLQLSYHDSDIPPVPVDGVYESATREAISRFQRKYGLPITGITDRGTWEAVYSEYQKSAFKYSEPEHITLFPAAQTEYEVTEGDIGFLVAAIQYILLVLSTHMDGFTLKEVTGIYDKPTTDSVRVFQVYSELSPTGRVDKTTWNRLARMHNTFAKDYFQ